MIVGNDDPPYFGTTEWFAEGATEYIANRTLIRTGIINRNTYLRKMETNIAMYEFWTWASPFQGVSIQNAGSKTALPMPEGMIAKTYNRPGVYSGGWTASFCIDMVIQKETRGARGLDDLFRLLFTRFGLTGKQWTPEGFVQSALEVAGTDLSVFFQKYIVAPSPLPVQQCLATAGFDGSILNYSGETFVTPKPNPSPLAQRIRDRLWTNSR